MSGQLRCQQTFCCPFMFMLKLTLTYLPPLPIIAPKFRNKSSQHRLQHPDHGVWQVHLCPGESGWADSGGDHWLGRPQYTYPQAHLSGQRHHESCQQSHCTQRYCGVLAIKCKLVKHLCRENGTMKDVLSWFKTCFFFLPNVNVFTCYLKGAFNIQFWQFRKT